MFLSAIQWVSRSSPRYMAVLDTNLCKWHESVEFKTKNLKCLWMEVLTSGNLSRNLHLYSESWFLTLSLEFQLLNVDFGAWICIWVLTLNMRSVTRSKCDGLGTQSRSCSWLPMALACWTSASLVKVLVFTTSHGNWSLNEHWNLVKEKLLMLWTVLYLVYTDLVSWLEA